MGKSFAQFENFAKEGVIISSGSTQAFDLAVRIFCNERDQVICEEKVLLMP